MRSTPIAAIILLAGFALVVADDAPAAAALPAPVAAAPAAAAAAPKPVAAAAAPVAAPSAGSGYRPQSAYTSTASYGAPHFLIMCILLVFTAAGCYEAYIRYGVPEAARKKKRHNTLGAYGAVTSEEEVVHTNAYTRRYTCTDTYMHTRTYTCTQIHTCTHAHFSHLRTHAHTRRATWRPPHSWAISRASWGAVPVRQARASAR